MNRSEIRQKFREENPSVTERVVTDATLNSWMLTADKEICAQTRCIQSNTPETFNASITLQYHDLSAEIPKFYGIDDIPGAGVSFKNKPLTRSSASQMNRINRNWKTQSAGTPKRYWIKQGRYLWFDRVASVASEIGIDVIFISDDFDNDAKSPYNSLSHLQPFHNGVNKYLEWQAQAKIKDRESENTAKNNYLSYVKWMKSMVSSASSGAIQGRPSYGQTG